MEGPGRLLRQSLPGPMFAASDLASEGHARAISLWVPRRDIAGRRCRRRTEPSILVTPGSPGPSDVGEAGNQGFVLELGRATLTPVSPVAARPSNTRSRGTTRTCGLPLDPSDATPAQRSERKRASAACGLTPRLSGKESLCESRDEPAKAALYVALSISATSRSSFLLSRSAICLTSSSICCSSRRFSSSTCATPWRPRPFASVITLS